MALFIKRRGHRPLSVGKLVVPWKIYDKDPRRVDNFVRDIAINPDMFDIVWFIANKNVEHLSDEDWKRLRDAANRVLEMRSKL